MLTEKPETTRSGCAILGRWFDWLQAHDVLTNVIHWPVTSEYPKEMRMELFIDGKDLIVRAEIAGLDPEKDFDIQVSDHTLHIHAERRQGRAMQEKRSYWSEFRYGSFARSIPLPPNATTADLKATYLDGILEVRVPIGQAEPEARKIPVQRLGRATSSPQEAARRGD